MVFAVQFDDDGSMDFWFFGTTCKKMQEASIYPIFWQFMGVGGSNYSILEKLDNMDGRVVDNANFFAIDDFDRVPDDELYERLLNEFPTWLKEARAKKIIR